jgi:hypothetical protein
MSRTLKSPEGFDRDLRELCRRAPWLSITSTRRTPERNVRVGGSPVSKHLISMAADLVSETDTGLEQAEATAVELGFWALIHGEGDARHLHVQGLPPGEVNETWLEMFS